MLCGTMLPDQKHKSHVDDRDNFVETDSIYTLNTQPCNLHRMQLYYTYTYCVYYDGLKSEAQYIFLHYLPLFIHFQVALRLSRTKRYFKYFLLIVHM